MARYIIIGGVAGGATTAARLRRNDETAEILLIERGEHISYANCGLPYYLGGAIQDRSRLFVQTPESFEELLNVQVRTNTEVLAIQAKQKTITLKNLLNGSESQESYDKLVLSPGAEPVKPPLKGVESSRIFTVRNVRDTDKIKSFLETQRPRKAVVVGAGFIGLEMAENLHEAGLKVTIVEMAAQVMTPLDYEMAAEVHQHLKVQGVEFYLKDGVSSFQENPEGIHLKLHSGRQLHADLIILSIGVRPDTHLAAEAGLTIGPTRGIVVDSHLRTSDPDIYAVGDAIEFPSPITGVPTITYLAGPANKQGRICANNIAYGNTHEYKGAIGTAVAKVFDLTVASTGVSEKILKKEKIPYKSCITHASSHAGYYPGATALSLKILFSPENGKLFGGQIVGFDGVDKRIDTIATVIRNGGSIHDLTEIEHAYAPPYSSAKDPVNILGFVAENILHGRSKHITWNQLSEKNADEIQLIDVRLPEETAVGSIDGSINIPLQEIRSRLSEIRRDRSVILYCGVGLRAYMAERILRQNGFTKVYNLSGGYKTWEHALQKQSNEDIFSQETIGKDDHIYSTDPETLAVKQGSSPGGISAGIPSPRVSYKTLEVDACGLQCPGPIMELKKAVSSVAQGDRIVEVASDPGFAKDVEAWCSMTGNTLLELSQEKGRIAAVIEKGSQAPAAVATEQRTKDTALVLFSDDFDRAMASLVIANGAVSSGKTATIFFTFWGLNLLKKSQPPKVKKDFMGRMFGMMLPKNASKLKLSKMNMGGMGVSMMRQRMKKLGIASLEEMFTSARENGVRLVACTMSMDVMGVQQEELIDGVEYGGVATFLSATDTATNTLFI